MKMTFLVVYAKGDSNLSGYAPDVPGCVSAGDTLDEMRANMKEALEFHLEGLAEDGLPLPEPVTTSIRLTEEDFADDVRYFIVDKLIIDVPESTLRAERISA